MTLIEGEVDDPKVTLGSNEGGAEIATSSLVEMDKSRVNGDLAA